MINLGNFNNGNILEKKPIGFPQDGGQLRPYSNLEGKISKLFKSKNLAIVEGVNMVKKHNKPSSQNPKGGITEQEAPIHISNLSLLTSKGETTRVGYKTTDGVKNRIALKSDEII